MEAPVKAIEVAMPIGPSVLEATTGFSAAEVANAVLMHDGLFAF